VLSLRAARDHEWYRHFLGEFDRIWSTATAPGKIGDGRPLSDSRPECAQVGNR
jgi:hypothetical protein